MGVFFLVFWLFVFISRLLFVCLFLVVCLGCGLVELVFGRFREYFCVGFFFC